MSGVEERLEKAKALLEGGKGEEARIALLEILKEDPTVKRSEKVGPE